jgi:hypothetical protein
MNINPYFQGYPMMQQPQNMQQMQAPTTPQIQNGGFVSVRSMAEAQNYPVAPGNSVTFKDENAPYVYTKTMGFSQLDRPIFEVFRLVKEEVAQQMQSKQLPDFRQEIDDLKAEIERIKKIVEVEEVEADE